VLSFYKTGQNSALVGIHIDSYPFRLFVLDRNVVHAFHDAALKAGGKCNGKPGLRPQYMRWYYGGFVLDPAGNNVETVCIWPGWTHLGYWFGMGAAFGKQKTN
jgi:hypothetical protein